MDLDNLGKKLKEVRLEKELSQEEVASKLFVSRQAVSRWETGKSIPDYPTLVSICELYNISLDNLFNIKTTNKEELIKTIMRNWKSQKKMIQVRNAIIGVVAILLIVFSLIFTFNNYNKSTIYEFRYISDEFSCKQGLVVTSPEFVYFKPCKIRWKDEKVIEKVKFYYYQDKCERLIIEGDYYIMDFLVRDRRNVAEYFDYKAINIDNKLPDIHVDFKTADGQEYSIVLESIKTSP